MLSPISPEAVAEQGLLRFFREQAVFSPPKPQEFHIYGPSQSQDINIERLLSATVKFMMEKCHMDRHLVSKILLKQVDMLL